MNKQLNASIHKILGKYLLILVGILIRGSNSAPTYAQVAVSDYYIINASDTNYPQGCTTAGLPNANEKCILAVPSTNITNHSYLIAPGITDIPKHRSEANNYCQSLNILGFSWRNQYAWGTERSWTKIFSNQAKLLNLTAPGSQKTNHYRAGGITGHNTNCSLAGPSACGGENQNLALSTRCVTEIPSSIISNYSLSCFDFDHDTQTITDYHSQFPGCGPHVQIPSTMGGKIVKIIGTNAFDSKGIKSVIIPNSVTQISAGAFRGNELTGVVIPHSVQTIETQSFANNKLISVKLSNSLETIPVTAFLNNRLASITLPSSIKTIDRRAFANNLLTEIIIPNSVTTIKHGAFKNNQISKLTLGQSVQHIESEAFQSNKLKGLIFPNTIKTIGEKAFYANSGTAYSAGAIEGFFDSPKDISLHPKANITVNPIYLAIRYTYENGHELKAPTILVGPEKEDFNGWTFESMSDRFQANTTYNIIAPQLVGFSSPIAKKITTPTSLNSTNNVLEIVFSYQLANLVLHHTFDHENNLGLDSSSQNNHAQRNRIDAVQRDDWGRYGGMLHLNTGNIGTHYLTTQHPLNIGERSGITFAIRVKTHTENTPLFRPTQGLPITTFQLSNGKPAFRIETPKSGGGYISSNETCGTQPVNDGQWHHLVRVMDKNHHQVSCYVDGNPQETKNINPTHDLNWLGQARIIHAGGWGEKSLDDLQVYNYPLRYAQIHTLYNSYGADPITAEKKRYPLCYRSFFTAINSQISISECKALLDLFRSTGGSQRHNNIGWKEALQLDITKYIRNICSWHGIDCTSGKISSISLPDNNLKGQLNSSISTLSNLQNLNLSKNPLTNVFPYLRQQSLHTVNLSQTQLEHDTFSTSFFSNNPQLEKINLSHAQISGSLPNFSAAPNLREIILDNNRLTGPLPDSLTRLQNLEILKFNDNYLIESIPTSLKEYQFPKLKTFDISRNYIAELDKSQAYLGLWTNNSAVRQAQANNMKQLRITFLDNKGLEIHKKDKLKPNEIVEIKLVKQLYNNGKYLTVDTISANDISLDTDGGKISIVENNFPKYKIRLVSNSDATFRATLRHASIGQLTQAKITLSEGAIQEEQEISMLTGKINADSTTYTGISVQLGSKYLDEYFSAVHFNVGGNDFGGGFFWLPVEKLEEPMIIQVKKGNNDGYERKKCHSQVKGFYYNSQRGERLRPLDSNSQLALQNFSPDTYGKLQLAGGRYTSCQGVNEDCNSGNCSEDSYGIYGTIKHTYGSNEVFHLNAGIPYNLQTNKMQSDGLRCNFQRLNNSYPFGYIYDEQGGVGFVGAKIRNEHIDNTELISKFHLNLDAKIDAGICINKLFSYNGKDVGYGGGIPGFNNDGLKDLLDFNLGSAKETLFNLGIKGIIGLTNEITNDEKKFFEGNTFSSTLLIRTDETIAKIINVVNKNAEKLCRGKWNTISDTKLICIDGGSSITRSADDLAGKTVVIKNTNLILSSFQNATDQPINLFIDKGNLLIPAKVNTGNMQKFDSFGYTTNDPGNGYSQANYLKGNFIINGLLLGGEDGQQAIENKLYIHGKLVSFNTFRKYTEERQQTIERILGQSLAPEAIPFIAMDNLFIRGCVVGTGTDGTWCQGISKDKKGNQTQTVLVDKAFGLIDMNFSSKLFN